MPALLAGRSVQGLGGGMLVALSYAMIRHLFPAALWPRAISLVSGMWGAAALTGPFVGGVFAELGAWRAAFWALLPLAAGFAALSARVLGRAAGGRDPDGGAPRPPARPARRGRPVGLGREPRRGCPAERGRRWRSRRR